MDVSVPFNKQPHTQPAPDMCFSTAVKVVIDNQFGGGISISRLNKACKYEGKYKQGIGIEPILEQVLTKLLKNLGITSHFKENLKIKDLYNLLNQGIYPIVFFRLRDLNKLKGNIEGIEVQEDNMAPNTHTFIVVGINEKTQKIKMFDTLYNKFKNYTNLNSIYDEVSFGQFLQCWIHDDLFYPAFYFTKEIKKEKAQTDKSNQSLEKWQQNKK